MSPVSAFGLKAQRSPLRGCFWFWENRKSVRPGEVGHFAGPGIRPPGDGGGSSADRPGGNRALWPGTAVDLGEGAAEIRPFDGYVIQLPSMGPAPHAGGHAEIHQWAGADTDPAWRCLLCPEGQFRVRCIAARPRFRRPRSRDVRDAFDWSFLAPTRPLWREPGCGDLVPCGAFVVSEVPFQRPGGRRGRRGSTLVPLLRRSAHVSRAYPPCRSRVLDVPSSRWSGSNDRAVRPVTCGQDATRCSRATGKSAE